MTGTGLKKCMPRNRSRRAEAVASASRRIAIELVFDAKIASGAASWSSERHSSCLTPRSSNTASTTRSASATRATSDVAVTRASVASRSSGVTLPFATDRSRLPAIRSRPASARSRSGS